MPAIQEQFKMPEDSKEGRVLKETNKKVKVYRYGRALQGIHHQNLSLPIELNKNKFNFCHTKYYGCEVPIMP